MESRRPRLFCKRQFELVIIVIGMRWYLRFPLSARDVEELVDQRGLTVDYTTIWRWDRSTARSCTGNCTAR